MLFCCEPCAMCGPGSNPSSSQRKRPRLKPDEKVSPLIGEIGVTDGPLNPTGYVVVGSQRVPARSQGEWVDDGTRVKVLSENNFGFIVRPV